VCSEVDEGSDQLEKRRGTRFYSRKTIQTKMTDFKKNYKPKKEKTQTRKKQNCLNTRKMKKKKKKKKHMEEELDKQDWIF